MELTMTPVKYVKMIACFIIALMLLAMATELAESNHPFFAILFFGLGLAALCDARNYSSKDR
jgi:hypothetical protein